MVKVPALAPSSSSSSKERAAWCRITQGCITLCTQSGRAVRSWVSDGSLDCILNAVRDIHSPTCQKFCSTTEACPRKAEPFIPSFFLVFPSSLFPHFLSQFWRLSFQAPSWGDLQKWPVFVCLWPWGQSAAAACCSNSISWRPLRRRISLHCADLYTHLSPARTQSLNCILAGAGEGGFVFLIPRIVCG